MYLPELLKKEFAGKKGRNPSYSLRAFAKHLGLSAGTLSELISEKRPVTLKNAQKILSRLDISNEEKSFIISSIFSSDSDEAHNQSKIYLEKELYDIIAEPIHFLIINLSECVDFRWSSKWMSKKINFTPLEIEAAIERLIRVGLVDKNENQYTIVEDFVIAPEGISSQAIRNYHHAMLQLAEKSLDSSPVDERDFRGIGFAIDPTHLPEFKKDILAFMTKMANKYPNGNKTKTYHLEIALFETTKEATNE